MQEITDELIEKFFNGLCSREEAEMVLTFLKSNPTHPYLLKEWEESDSLTPLPEELSDVMLETVTAATSEPEKKNRVWISRFAAAACLIGIVASVWLFKGREDHKSVIASAGQTSEQLWITQSNNSNINTVIQMSDSSMITLSPHASVRYLKQFGSNSRRDIYLTGEAYFKVAKNKNKPFTVFSDDISTTALGTAFRVTNNNDAQVTVKLYEGKVMIALNSPGSGNKKYFLSPGEQLVFNKNKKMFFVKAFIKKNNNVKADKEIKVLQPSVVEETYMFNNQTLPDVLDQLSALYHVPVNYSKAELGKIYFIGKIEPGDSIEKTLNDIALLNKLKITKLKSGGYYIRRKKP